MSYQLSTLRAGLKSFVTKLSVAIASSAILMVSAGHAATSIFTLPQYQVLRFNENWSVLRNANMQTWQSDIWNKIKFIPLNRNESGWISFGGDLRYRHEFWRHFGFNPANDNNFSLWRLLAHADVHFSDKVRMFVEGKSALAGNRTLPGGRRVQDVDTLDLQQLFMDIQVSDSITLRPGRQEFSFGSQRLVSPALWNNTMNTWDGLSVLWTNHQSLNLQAFLSRYVQVNKYRFNRGDVNNSFNGMFAHTILPGTSKVGWDLYWFYLNKLASTFDRQVGRDRRHTLGSRIFGNFAYNNLADYDLEGAMQYGNYVTTANLNRDVTAYMLSGLLGYRLPGVSIKPRVFVGYDYASGGSPGGKRMRTFNQLFPASRTYLGYMDAIGRQNVADYNGGVTFSPIAQMIAGINYHLFYRASGLDGVYDNFGATTIAGNAGAALKLGNEMDLYLQYPFNKHVSTVLGVSHFAPGTFLSQSGFGTPTDFGYAQIQYTI